MKQSCGQWKWTLSYGSDCLSMADAGRDYVRSFDSLPNYVQTSQVHIGAG
jgi:hypothetical protein